MKRSSFVLCVLTSLFFSMHVYGATTVDQVVALERQHNFSTESNLYTYIQERPLTNGLKTICSSSSVQEADRLASRIEALLEELYTPKTEGEQLLLSLQLRDRLHRIHSHMTNDTDSRFCLRKEVLYRLQGRLREWHVAILERTDIIKDFTEENPPLIGYETKYELLQSYLKDVAPTGLDLTVETENPEKLIQLPHEQRQLTILSRQVMDRAIQEVLAEFESNGWFTRADSDKIRQHIFLEFTDSCTSYNGSYEVRQTFSSAGKLQKVETLGLHLKVTTCTRLYVLLHLKEIYKKLIYHELGHHMRRYHDADPTRFTQQCRTSEGYRNTTCVSRDFVSDYAQQAPEEDYAETFQQRVLQSEPTSLIMRRKFAYFDALFN